MQLLRSNNEILRIVIYIVGGLVGLMLFPISLPLAGIWLAWIAWGRLKHTAFALVVALSCVIGTFALDGVILTHTRSISSFLLKQQGSTANISTGADTNDDANDQGTAAVSKPAPAKSTSSQSCDPALWDHVYHPGRLHILDNCISVTGVIEVIRHEADGDYHILLKLDSKYSNLINDKNTTGQHGDLVLEPVCEDAATQSDAVAFCQNYRSPVHVPTVGTHVTVVGAFVLDADHGWNEIHPVSSITTVGQSQAVASTPAPATTPVPAVSSGSDVYYANCTAARDAGAAPIYRGQPGYRAALDRDGDGIACE